MIVVVIVVVVVVVARTAEVMLAEVGLKAGAVKIAWGEKT